MKERGVRIKSTELLKLVGSEMGAYRVGVCFTEVPKHASVYTVCAKSDKLASDKGLRLFIADVAKACKPLI